MLLTRDGGFPPAECIDPSAVSAWQPRRIGKSGVASTTVFQRCRLASRQAASQTSRAIIWCSADATDSKQHQQQQQYPGAASS